MQQPRGAASCPLPLRAALLCAAALLLLLPLPPGLQQLLPAARARAPHALPAAAPLACRAVRSARLLLSRNDLPANDSALGPLELRVPGCSPALDSAQPQASAPAARACLRGRHVLFVGDSTMRFQFLNFIHWLHAGSWEALDPPLERDGEAWGAEGWDSFFEGSARAVPHVCDCARCRGTQLFEDSARWDVGGVRMLCAMENRYYVHAASGTRASFILHFGHNPIGWSSPEFLGLGEGGCYPQGCAQQQGCAPGACYPPLRAAPPAEALRALLPQLRPTHIVLSSGVWGGYEGAPEELAALVAALRSAPGRPRVLWRTPTPPRPGAHPLAEWSPTWHSPAAEAAFEAQGWGVVHAGALLAAAMAHVELRPAMPCSACIAAVEGRLEGVAPHWSCTYCVMRSGEAGEGGGAGDERHAGLLAELGEEAGRTRAWPWKERDARAEDILQRSKAARLREGSSSSGTVPVEAVWDDWVHAAPAFNRLLNTLLLAHLCEEDGEAPAQ